MSKLIKKYSNGKEYAGTLQADEIADGAITNPKLADNAVDTDEIADGAITNPKLADNAVDTDEIADGAITNPKLADNAVDTDEIADGAITTAKFATDCENPEYITHNSNWLAITDPSHTITFNGSHIAWDNYIHVEPVPSPHIYQIATIVLPSSGQPVNWLKSNGTTSTVVVTSDGIPISNKQALFVKNRSNTRYTTASDYYVVDRERTDFSYYSANFIILCSRDYWGRLWWRLGRLMVFPAGGDVFRLDAIDGAELAEDYLLASLKGAANGVAELGSDGLVKASQLPASWLTVEHYANLAAFPTTGETDVLYVADDTNQRYMWDGSDYVNITGSLALGETSTTAYRGDRGKAAYDHSQLTTGNPHNLDADDVGAVDSLDVGAANGVASLDSSGKIPETELDGKLYKLYTHTQNTAATQWNINHDLDKQYCDVKVKTSGGIMIEVLDIDFTDENNLIINFAAAESGTAYIS